MLTLSKLKSNIAETTGVLDSFKYQEQHVVIFKDLSIYVNEELIKSSVKTLEEASSYVKKYINNSKILEKIDTLIPEEKIVNLIRKYHDIEKITDTLVESYIELASSNIFSIDPVITDIKQNTSSNFAGKLEYNLDDGSIVAIDEDTQRLLNTLLKDKYQIIEYMRESKENFMHVIRKLEE
jgi:hypothetical protein